MESWYLLMSTPNLRFNKSLTKKILKSCPEDRISRTAIDWHLDAGDKVYGSYFLGWFNRTSYMFLLQRVGKDDYRLVVPDHKTGLCFFYLIDDIDAYLDYVGVEELDVESVENTVKALKDTEGIPHTGLITIEENKLFVYEHENY